MKRTSTLVTAMLLTLLLALPANASSVRFVEDFDSIVVVGVGDNDIGVLLASMQCTFIKRVVHPDGSATETQHCMITGPFLDFGPEYAGDVPDATYVDSGGECLWESDYWLGTTGESISANRYTSVAMPSGNVYVKAEYRADLLTGEECGW